MTRVHAMLLLGVALLALGGPLTKMLIRDGGELGLVAPESISFCNVLFVGNLCGGLLAIATLGPRGVFRELRATDLRTRVLLAVGVIFAVLIPSLLFTALESTTVTNVILLGRFEAIAFLGCGLLFGAPRPTKRTVIGYSVILVGVLTLILLEGMGAFMQGDVLVIIAALLQGIAAHAAKATLGRTTLRVFVFLRNLGSAVVFFVIAIRLFGFEHFEHAFRPSLWPLMLAYSLVAIVLAQLAWYWSLEKARPTTVANFSLLAPAFGILFAFALLGEVPTASQIQGGVIILIGMLIARSKEDAPAPVETSLSALGR